MDMELIKRTGIKAAYNGAKVLEKYFGKLKKVGKKGKIDLVTVADIESEKIIIETIKDKFCNHSILAEECGKDESDSIYKWVIDPLDGTTNFVHNLGIFSVSIAFQKNQETLFGLVLNPETGELFTAIKGQGALLNDHTIKVSNTKKISESLLVTGFPYDNKDLFEILLSRFTRCLKESQGIRRLGSAALDLCFVACGRFDGFWEQNLKPWDTAAGVLIAKEAGAIITDFSNKAYDINQNEILATNGYIHKELLNLLIIG